MQIPEFQHANVKKVSIQRFSSAKSLIELTCQIIENTPSLRCLELNTTRDLFPSYTCKDDIRKSRCAAVEAIERYIVGKVPSSVEFKVLEPWAGAIVAISRWLVAIVHVVFSVKLCSMIHSKWIVFVTTNLEWDSSLIIHGIILGSSISCFMNWQVAESYASHYFLMMMLFYCIVMLKHWVVASNFLFLSIFRSQQLIA